MECRVSRSPSWSADLHEILVIAPGMTSTRMAPWRICQPRRGQLHTQAFHRVVLQDAARMQPEAGIVCLRALDVRRTAEASGRDFTEPAADVAASEAVRMFVCLVCRVKARHHAWR